MIVQRILERIKLELLLLGKEKDKKEYLKLVHSDFYDADLSERYEILNRYGQIHHFKKNNVWLITGFDIAEKILNDHYVFSSNDGVDPYMQWDKHQVLLCATPERHELIHSLVRDCFMIQKEDAFMQQFLDHLHELTSHLPKDTTVDFKIEVINPLVAYAICYMAGFGANDSKLIIEKFKEYDLWQFNPWFLDHVRSLDLFSYAVASENKLIRVLQEAVRNRHLTEEEAFELLSFVFLAGTETVSSTMQRIFEKILTDKNIRYQLKEDQSLRAKFIEEIIRLHPVPRIPRRATTDVDLEGVVIPKGAMVVTELGAVNRDPVKFNSPEEFTFHTTRSRNLSFGAGIHKCIGMGIARTESRLFLDFFLDNETNIMIEQVKWMRLREFSPVNTEFMLVKKIVPDTAAGSTPRCPF